MAENQRLNVDIQQDAAAPQSKGHLERLLRNYDLSQTQEEHPLSLTINIPDDYNSNSITKEKIMRQRKNEQQDIEENRDRSSTLASESDLNWALLDDVEKDRGMSISSILTSSGDVLGEDERLGCEVENKVEGWIGGGGDGNMSEGTSVTFVSRSTTSVVSCGGVTSTGLSMLPQSADYPTSHLPCLPENCTSLPKITAKQKTLLSSGSPSDSYESISMYLNNVCEPQMNRMNKYRHQTMMIAHTPPTHLGTSYENSHFSKRIRSGSISGRLRSASDLEDIGIISSEQKAILKDLIIAGNDEVQGAIDKYEAGDSTVLENMIKNGALVRSVDVDLLGDLDLDLDFLNVHEDDGLVFDVETIDDIIENDHSMLGLKGVAQKYYGKITPINVKSDTYAASSSINIEDDGIGDLEFNVDMSNGPEMRNTWGELQYENHSSQHMTTNSDETLEMHRMRTNSLALSGFVLEGANHDELDHLNFAQWMDSHHVNGTVMRQGVSSIGSQYIHGQSKLLSNSTQSLCSSSNSFKLQCDLLMQKEQEIINSSSPAAVESILLGDKTHTLSNINAKEKKAKNAFPSPNAKKEKKQKNKGTNCVEVKRPKKKSTHSTEELFTSSIHLHEKVEKSDEEDYAEVPSGLGRPRTMSDPNLSVRLDEIGLLHVSGPKGWVGAYSPDSREIRINRYLEKRNSRIWVKKVKYDVRKNFADSRLRVKGRFVKKEDELLMRELMSLT